MRPFRILALAVCLLALSGCHSARVQTTVSNRTGQTILLLEVDYPSASFGTQYLASGGDFHYRFKVLGTGKVSLTYTDQAHHDHKFEGPYLDETADGPLQITIAPDGVQWKTGPKTTIKAPPTA